MHGGSIVAHSAGRDQGATFTLRVETINASEAAAAPPAMADGGSTKAYRVLLVEDHDDTRRVLARLLASFGFVVTSAATVKEAIDASQHQRFDLLVSDIGLPDGSGLDVMKHMARLNVTGIALSGFGQDEDLQRSRDAGFTIHLTKPVSLQALQDVIKKVTPA